MNLLELFTDINQSDLLVRYGFHPKSCDCIIAAEVEDIYGNDAIKHYPAWSVVTLLKYLPMVLEYNTDDSFKLLHKKEFEEPSGSRSVIYVIQYVDETNRPVICKRTSSKINTVIDILLELLKKGYNLSIREN